MNVRRQFLLSLLAASLFPQWGGAQELPTDVRQEIGKFLDTTARKEVSVGRISIDSVAVEGNTLQLFANMNCAYIPFREDNVAEIYQGVSPCYRRRLPNTSCKSVPTSAASKNWFPKSCVVKKTKRRRHQSRRFQAFSYRHFRPLHPYQRLAEPAHRPMAKPRLVLRAETRPLGMAACTYLPDRGRPLHPKLRIAFPRADAGKCRCQRAASPRTRLPDGRSHRRQ